MSRRTDRVGNLIRQILAEAVHRRLSDPRIDPARTSLTRVEVAEDLLTAKVFVSVLGTEADERRTLRALAHAAGRLQEMMRREITLRHTPVLSFLPDVQFKKTLKTLQLIDQAMDEIRQKEQARAEAAGGPDAPGTADEDAS